MTQYPRSVHKPYIEGMNNVCVLREKGGDIATLVVENEREHQEKLANGWFDTVLEAQNASSETLDISDLEDQDRQQLKDMAKDLGLKIRGNPSSETLIKKIQDAQGI